MKRVLIIGVGSTFGGKEKFIYDVYDRIIGEELIADVLCYTNPAKQVKDLIEHKGGKCYYIAQYSKRPLVFLKSIYKFYSNHRYDIIHCHATHTTVIMYALPVWFSKQVDIFFHSHSTHTDHPIMHCLLRPVVNKRCKKRFACSETAGYFMYGGLNGIDIIKNGIPTSMFAFNNEIRVKVRRQYNIAKDTLVIGHVGRFTNEKNQIFLLDVLLRAKKILPNVKLMLVGDGVLKELVYRRCIDMGLFESVLFVGEQMCVAPFYQAMDAFFLPSLYEGLPFAAVEAQASGLFTVLSDRVSSEAQLLSDTLYLSLDVPDEWANCLIDKYQIHIRKNEKNHIMKLGYDIDEIAGRVKQSYFK